MRTSISDYEMDRAWTVGAEAEGATVEAKPVTKSKVVEAEDKPAPKKTTARSKSDKS